MLKSLLSLLLSKFYSKQESALVASLALPDKSVSTSVSVTGGRNEYVAPNDGYLEFITTVTNNGINVYGQVLQTSSYPREGRAAKLFVPIAKGKKIIFETAADTSATFYALVWGGVSALKNALLQGGAICLSNLCSSLRRNSYRTSGSGWRSSRQFLFKALLNYLLLQMEKVTHSPCHTRGLSTSEVMEFGLPILEGSISSISDHLRMGIFRSGLTLKKVKNLPTQLGDQISSLLPIFEYTKSRGTIDQMFGCASC
nr:MAG TPA: hypothetical protein [Caudoviricetes sp.]